MISVLEIGWEISDHDLCPLDLFVSGITVPPVL